MHNRSYFYYGHGNCARLPELNSYAEAKEHFDKVLPIRGRREEIKPLGEKRRFAWYTIRKNTIANQYEGNEYNTYACNLYGSDCVEFFPDGAVHIKTMGWHTPTTMAFVNYVTRNFGFMNSFNGKWYWRVTATGKHYPMPSNYRGQDATPLILKPNADGILEPINQEPEHKYKVSRKAMNAIRKKYEEFRDYARVTLSISPTIQRLEVAESSHGIHALGGNLMPSRWSYQDTNTRARKNRTNLFKALDKYKENQDAGILYEAMCYIGFEAGAHNWRNNDIYCYPEAFAKFFDELIKYTFADDVLIAEPQEIGVAFHDKNLKYVLGK